ncbi:hypothetical protein [Yoonia sp. R2-816]|uniref:hypothetical protein n=1 Tax=Yoonia sp. R2-816 TaxID=3342638 RepID=UPI0037271B2D
MIWTRSRHFWSASWNSRAAFKIAHIPAIVWITKIHTAIFANASKFTLLQFATQVLPSSKAMAYTYLTPEAFREKPESGTSYIGQFVIRPV